jgi:hypothetical protein
MEKEKIMVLGASRGGTTILAATLGSHSRVAMLDEDLSGAFVRITGNKIPAVKLCVPNQIEFEKRWSPLYRLGLMNGFFRKSAFMNRIPKSPRSIADYHAQGGIRPVCVLRHPAGVIPAIMKRENKKEKVAVYRWQRCLAVFKTLQQDGRYNPVFVSFEKLVTAPEPTLRALCDALGLPYEDQMLAAPQNNERYTQKTFEPAKAAYEKQDEIWSLLPPRCRDDYRMIENLTVG